MERVDPGVDQRIDELERFFKRHAAGKHTHNAAFEVFPRQLCRNKGQGNTGSQNNYRCFRYTNQLSQKVIPSVGCKGRTDTVACNHQCIFTPLLRPAYVAAMCQSFTKQSSQQAPSKNGIGRCMRTSRLPRQSAMIKSNKRFKNIAFTPALHR